MKRSQFRSYGDLKSRYLSLFKKKQEPDVKKSINHALRRLINAGLLKSAEYYYLDNDKLAGRIDGLEIDKSGYFYIQKLIYNFEYLSYLKDDVDYGDYEVYIEDNIDAVSLKDRYASVIKFIEFYFERETELLESFSIKKLQKYRASFSPSKEQLFFSQNLARNLSGFGYKRPVNWSDARILFEKIKLKNREILEKINA